MHFAYSRGMMIMAGPFDHLVGELLPGQTGWLPLDANGIPTGPATINPPPPPAFACSVQVSAESPLPEDAHLLTTSTGAPLITPLTSNVEHRTDDGSESTPTISALNPASAVVGDPEFGLVVEGTGFGQWSVITLDGADVETIYFSPTQLGTTLHPETATAGTVQVAVRNSAMTSNSMSFEYTAPVVRGGGTDTSRKHKFLNS